ncbi:unnamed protein product [Cylicocyclus nassatus]|uniref:Potassium channel domain-containing protein n=1 Tax=Cylicocyclus nassatus TaxID=53992 RepID=A0AA36M3B5_CYLNA|nr:unnamed protein product [Cylicocyclus nassatus]
MLGQVTRRHSNLIEDAKRDRGPPKNWLGKAKYYYDKYNCRYFAPFLLLFVYSILGAWIFYLVEYNNEKQMKAKEQWELDRLRNNTFQKIAGLLQANRRSERVSKSRNLLLWYEKEYERVKLPEALEWNMWGALFYVGTVFTTIGYGNIVPRTVLGRALSVVYAIIGIPLVLAILSRFGQFLEHTITRAWLRHRKNIKNVHRKTSQRLRNNLLSKPGKVLEALEEGRLSPTPSEHKEGLIEDSRTIPIWLALLLCIGWVCGCAALFLIWEKRWTFFTSLYFFFISLSTIGLGDVVPDHPHMLILMFFLVIIGLSIVSMLLTVIQIKFEECLYNLMMRMQEEYQKNLANGTPFDHEEIRKKAMEEQPFFMKFFGPDLMSDEQREKIEETAQQFEKIVRETNTKNIQTEPPAFFMAGTQMDNLANSIACDPMSDNGRVANGETQWSRASRPDGMMSAVNEQAQTDIAQFQIDEIILRLAALQAKGSSSDDVEEEKSEWSFLPLGKRSQKIEEKTEGKNVKDMTDREILAKMLEMMTNATEVGNLPEKVELGVNTVIQPTASLGVSTDPVTSRTKSMETDVNDVTNRSMATDRVELMDKTVETSRSERVEPKQLSWTEKTHRDMMTSPVLRRLLLKTSAADTSHDYDDESQQTSLIIDRPAPDTDRSIQTSPSEQRRTTRSVQFAPDCIERMTSPIQNGWINRSLQTSLDDTFCRSQQTSLDMIDEMAETSHVEFTTTGVGPDREEPGLYSPGTDWCAVNGSMYDNHRMPGSMETSTQYSPPMSRSVTTQNADHLSVGRKARSSSTSGLGTSICDDDNRQEVIIQTDDSYLKIARRLDEYRTNHTQFLPVVAASPLESRDIQPFKTDRPSEHRGYFMDPKALQRRRSSVKKVRRPSYKSSNAEAQTGSSMDHEQLDPLLKQNERSRSISPESPPRPRRVLARVASLPIGVARGKVSEFVAKHERGIPNPAVVRDRPVRIVRQYAMVDKAT